MSSPAGQPNQGPLVSGKVVDVYSPPRAQRGALGRLVHNITSSTSRLIAAGVAGAAVALAGGAAGVAVAQEQHRLVDNIVGDYNDAVDRTFDRIDKSVDTNLDRVEEFLDRNDGFADDVQDVGIGLGVAAAGVGILGGSTAAVIHAAGSVSRGRSRPTTPAPAQPTPAAAAPPFPPTGPTAWGLIPPPYVQGSPNGGLAADPNDLSFMDREAPDRAAGVMRSLRITSTSVEMIESVFLAPPTGAPGAGPDLGKSSAADDRGGPYL